MADTDAMLTVDRSNYTICRVIARRSPPRVRARPEVCYQPLLLRELAACTLIVARCQLPPSLPADLETLLDAARKRAANRMESCRWDVKDRTCPDITYLRIGNFEEYPGFMNRYLPEAFSCPLAEQAPRILAMLASADACQELSTVAFVATTIRVRYPLFLRLQSAHPTEILVPPIDVQSVWFTHMLQSDAYLPWMQKHWPEVAKLPHVATRVWTSADMAKAEQRTMALWAEHKQPWRTEPGPEPPGKVDADVPAITTVLNDRHWYRQFLNATRNNSHLSQPEFYARAALGYQRFMFLIAKLPNRMESFGFAPSPPIDLIWHTHLAQPLAFRADWTRLLGHVHHHKLLKPEDRRRVAYDHPDPEVRLWRTEFNESFQLYATELTQTPTPYEEQRHYAKPAQLPPPKVWDV